MAKIRKKGTWSWIILLFLIIGSIILGIADESKQTDVKNDTLLEKFNKIFILVFILITFLSYWIIPKTKLADKIKLMEGFFSLFILVGMVCGLFGLIATYLWPDVIEETHLMFTITIPFFMMFTFLRMVKKIKRNSEIFDEKQRYDLSQAGYTTMTLGFVYMLFNRFIFNVNLWFPYYLFTTILIFSVLALYFYKRN